MDCLLGLCERGSRFSVGCSVACSVSAGVRRHLKSETLCGDGAQGALEFVQDVLNDLKLSRRAIETKQFGNAM